MLAVKRQVCYCVVGCGFTGENSAQHSNVQLGSRCRQRDAQIHNGFQEVAAYYTRLSKRPFKYPLQPVSCYPMKENTVLPSKYEALFGEDFTMITITSVVY